MVLTDSELEYITKTIGREPNALEEGMLDIMFSEHCSYKSSRPILRRFPNDSSKVILGPGDDAGVVEVTDELALAIGIESHNHPSAIEPYGGAGTGIGGILRDIISMGAMPIALLDSLRFGPLDDQKSCYLFENVVKGISDYGNRVGIPTVGGEVEFDKSFQYNPLVNVMCVGLVNKKDLQRGIAPNVGDVFFLMGGLTGRDGIHGVTFASEELTTSSEIEDRPAVQIGDPFTKKRVLEASLEIMEQIDVSGVKDLGGGGITCCTSELVDTCENGAHVDINKIPLREEGMTPYEIMLSESQERMIFVIKPEDVDTARKICEKHELPSAVIGEVTDSVNITVTDNEDILCDLPTRLLADPPTIEREAKEPVKNREVLDVSGDNAEDSLIKILSSQNMANKKWVYRQYDHEVQIRTMVKPGDDAAVLRIDDNTAIALTTDCNSLHTALDPYDGGAGCVAEAIRNVVAMGCEPICVVDCLNFGNPEKPEVFWEFTQCVTGMSEIAETFDVGVISGNVSFYNEKEGVTVNPSPTVGVVGVADIENIRTLDFKNEGDAIVIIGETFDEMGGSEYYRSVYDTISGHAPKIRLNDELESACSILNMLSDDSNKDITAVHDCSAGGIGIALADMCIKSGLGADVDLSQAPGDIEDYAKLFSESHARYIITVKPEKLDDILENIDVPCAKIGEVKGDSLKINGLVDLSISKLEDAFEGTIENFMV